MQKDTSLPHLHTYHTSCPAAAWMFVARPAHNTFFPTALPRMPHTAACAPHRLSSPPHNAFSCLPPPHTAFHLFAFSSSIGRASGSPRYRRLVP